MLALGKCVLDNAGFHFIDPGSKFPCGTFGEVASYVRASALCELIS